MFDKVLRAFEHAPDGLLQRIKALPRVTDIHAQDDGSYDLLIYDVIGCGCCDPADIAQALASTEGAPINLRLNSPGGDAFAGFAIYNLLNSHEGDVNVIVDGVAASAAAYLAMAGNTVQMQPASFMMIHNAWTITAGDKAHLATQIDALKRLDNAQTKLFSDRTGISPEKISQMLDAETWFSADEAVEHGFASNIYDPHAPSDAFAGLTDEFMAQFDPDGDGDDDLAEALAYLQSAIGSISDAVESLTGTGPDDDDMEQQMALAFALEKRKRLLQARLLTRYK